MYKFFLFFLSSFFILVHGSAQAPVAKDTVLKDSTAILQDLMGLLDSTEEPASYALIAASIGNRLFSLHNNQLNSQQSSTATIVYNPSLGYFHKSGFSLSAGAYLINDAAKGFGASQYSVTPAFDLPKNQNFSFGISYTRFFVKDKFSPYSSPIQNDFYTSASYNKPWLQPGIALGYSTGEYRQSIIKDTTINNIHRVFYDTATFKLTAFSMMLSVSHQFDWYKLFNKNDAFVLTPSLLLNLGSSSTDITHKTNIPQPLQKLLIKRGRLRRQLNNNFQAESLGLNIDGNYALGNFSFNPQLYLDYYLTSTTEQRFTEVFTLSVGYSF